MLSPIESPRASTDRKAEASKDIVVNSIPPTSLGELKKPAYPPAALAAHVGECVVNVTITIDSSGEVSEVIPSWQRLNVPNRFSDDFLQSIKSAVGTWRFSPARNVYWQKNGDDDPKYLYAETVPARTDVRFTFEASGVVR